MARTVEIGRCAVDDMEILRKVFANVGSPPAVDAYCKASILEAIRLTRVDCAQALGRKASVTIAWEELAKLPVRQCMTFHACCLCKLNIRMGDQYHDGGHKKRAHVECVQNERRRSTC